MKAKNVAKHIINYCISINTPISNLQLQKILYFIDIYHLIRTNKRLIDDEYFKTNKYGCFIENIYKEYLYFASNPINIYQDDATEEFEINIKGELYGYIDKLSKMYPSFLVEKNVKINNILNIKEDTIIANEILNKIKDETIKGNI